MDSSRTEHHDRLQKKGGGLYFTVPSSPLSHARVSALRIGSGWPQSTQRSLRPPVSFTSISLIALWHIGQSDVADWVGDMIHAFIRRERKALSHRWLPMAGGDGISLAHCKALHWAILLTFQKLML